MKLIDKLPYFYEECPKVNSIQEGLQSEADILYRKVDNTRNQLYVSSATWGLDLWEKFAGIKKKAKCDNRKSVIVCIILILIIPKHNSTNNINIPHKEPGNGKDKPLESNSPRYAIPNTMITSRNNFIF